MKKHRRIVWQIFPSYLLIIVLALLAVALYAAYAEKQFYLEKTREHLEALAVHFRSLIKEKIAAAASNDIDRLCKAAGAELAIRFTVILPSGLVLGDSSENPANMDNHADRPEIQQALAGAVGISTRYSYTLKEEMFYVAIPIRNAGQMIGIVRTAMPVPDLEQTLHATYLKITLVGIVVAVFAAFLSLLIAYYINKPLEELRTGAEHFARGDLHHRIRVTGSREIEILAETMNQMAAQLEERIRTITDQRNELEAVLTNMVEAVVLVDQNEKIVKCNQTASALFGIAPERIGRSLQECIRNINIQRFVKKTLEGETPQEEVVTLNSGQEFFLQAHGTLLLDHANQSASALLVFHDITRLKQLENVRREFVANVSHELKTPITSIKGFIETLRDGALHDPEHAVNFLEIMERNVNRLNAIIDDLLMLSKIEQEEDAKQLLLTEKNIRDVLDTAVLTYENAAKAKNVTIAMQCPHDLRAPINPDLLVQAVGNLLDNAIKYSAPGSTITVQALQQQAEVVIYVQDSGCGIAKEHLPRLFERFYRVDKARSRKIGGTGLGLAIVKHIVNAHQGRVAVESTPGQGSTFSIMLPA